MEPEPNTLVKQFIRYVIPSIAAQWVYALYNMVDGIFVARGVGEQALTAVNLSNPFLQLMFALSLLFAVGASTVTSILLGRGECRQASQVFSQTVLFLGGLGLLLAGLVLPNLERAARFLGAQDPETLLLVQEYLRFVAPFAPAFLLSYAFEVLIKTDGYPRKAVAIVILGAVENCVLDWLLVMVLHKGVAGAAFATGFSQFTLTLIYLRHFLQKRGSIHFVRFPLRLSLLLREACCGFSAALTELSTGAVTLIFNRVILLCLSRDALVSYAIVSYLNSLTVFSVIGVVQGSQPLISRCYGRQERGFCRRLLRLSLGTSLGFCLGAALLCALFAGPIAACYIGPGLPELRLYSQSVIRIFVLSFLLMGVNVSLSGYLAAVECSGPAVLISGGRGFVLLVASLFLLTRLFGGAGVWWASLLSESVTLCLGLGLCFQLRGRMFPPAGPQA